MSDVDIHQLARLAVNMERWEDRTDRESVLYAIYALHRVGHIVMAPEDAPIAPQGALTSLERRVA